MPHIGWVELTLILVIVAMLFGVGKLPEVFGTVGKGIREFRKEAGNADKAVSADKVEPVAETRVESNP
jgi:sec-independent protein translocase protein TatA